MPNPNFKYNYETRVEVVMEVLRGKRPCDLERERGINQKTINNWLNTYRDEAERRIKLLTIDQDLTGLKLRPESDRPSEMTSLFLQNLKRRQLGKKPKDCWRVDIGDLFRKELSD